MEKTLYKRDANGGIRVWRIETETDGLFMEFGTLNGNLTEDYETIIEGKANRSLEDQIELRFNSRINKKLDSGYVDNIKDVGNRPKNTLGFEKAMKAQKYKDVQVNFNEPTFLQAKYNGHRCMTTNNGGEIIPYSRNGKLIESIEHITSKIVIPEGVTIDGELYIHGVSLQKLGSLIRKNQVGSLDLKYVVYDIMTDEPYSERLEQLKKIVIPSSVTIAPTQQVHDDQSVWHLFKLLRSQGYEGAILRHGEAGYEYDKRSKSLLKVKAFDDDEFLVIDILKSKDGWARLVCETKDGKEFKVSAPGSIYNKTLIWRDREEYIGKHVRVEYADFTDDGKPFHPVATMFRDKKGE